MTDLHTHDSETLHGQPEHQLSSETALRSLGFAAELGDQDAKAKNEQAQTKFDELLVRLDSNTREAVLEEHYKCTFGPKGMSRYEAMQYIIDIFETPATSQHDEVALPDAPLSAE